MKLWIYELGPQKLWVCRHYTWNTRVRELCAPIGAVLWSKRKAQVGTENKGDVALP